jgi:hypothetical protein
MLQNVVDDDMRGRVMSFFAMANMGTAPFGSILVGSSAKFIGAPNTLLIGGIFCILGAFVFAYKLKEITNAIVRNQKNVIDGNMPL